MKTNDLRKGDMVLVNVDGTNCKARIEDNRKGNARFCYVFGEKIGLFNEFGSVYGHNILYKVEGRKRIKIEHTDKQIKRSVDIPRELRMIFKNIY